MNRVRRNKIEKACDDLEAALEALREAAEEEREYFDNMPENMQQGEKGQAASDAADTLETACDEIEGSIANARDVAMS